MSTPHEPTRPNDDALTEPTEGHVDVDAAAAWHSGQPEPNEPLGILGMTMAGVGGAAAGKPIGIMTGAGLTDHDEPAEGGRERAEDGSSTDEPGVWRRQGDEGAP